MAARRLLAALLVGAAGAGCADTRPLREPQDESAGPAIAPPGAQLRTAMQAGPRAALDLLLTWDTAGLRHEPAHAAALADLYCFLPDQGCLSEEPGTDYAIAVRGYQLEPVYETPDSAAYRVVFDEIGVVWPDGMEEAEPAEPQVVRLARLDGAWRVVGPGSQLPPHLSIDAIARRYRGVQPDSAVIIRWLRERA